MLLNSLVSIDVKCIIWGDEKPGPQQREHYTEVKQNGSQVSVPALGSRLTPGNYDRDREIATHRLLSLRHQQEIC